MSDVSKYPAVRYHPDGRSIRVVTEAHDKSVIEDGWSATPFPPLPEPKPKMTIEQRVLALEEQVSVLEALLKKTKKVA